VAAVSEKHPALGTTLAKGVILEKTADKLIITVEGSGLAANMITKNMAVIRSICRELFGRHMAVDLDVVQNQSSKKKKKKKRETLAKHDALSHPLVADALAVFEGKIVDVKIRE
jgi:DNA polymerase-3 subunit gamma/tau